MTRSISPGISLLSLLVVSAARVSIKDLHIQDLVLTANKGGGGPNASTIIWSPSIVVTKDNITLANADAQWKVSEGLTRTSSREALACSGMRISIQQRSFQDVSPDTP